MPDPIVIDASAWLTASLNEPGADLIQAHLVHHHLLAPELIRYEIAQGLLKAHRKGYLRSASAQGLEDLLQNVLQFPIETVPADIWWRASVKCVRQYALTFYDAAYVGLASVLKVPVLTCDKQILAVLKSEKLEIV